MRAPTELTRLLCSLTHTGPVNASESAPSLGFESGLPSESTQTEVNEHVCLQLDSSLFTTRCDAASSRKLLRMTSGLLCYLYLFSVSTIYLFLFFRGAVSPSSFGRMSVSQFKMHFAELIPPGALCMKDAPIS